MNINNFYLKIKRNINSAFLLSCSISYFVRSYFHSPNSNNLSKTESNLLRGIKSIYNKLYDKKRNFIEWPLYILLIMLIPLAIVFKLLDEDSDYKTELEMFINYVTSLFYNNSDKTESPKTSDSSAKNNDSDILLDDNTSTPDSDKVDSTANTSKDDKDEVVLVRKRIWPLSKWFGPIELTRGDLEVSCGDPPSFDESEYDNHSKLEVEGKSDVSAISPKAETELKADASEKESQKSNETSDNEGGLSLEQEKIEHAAVQNNVYAFNMNRLLDVYPEGRPLNIKPELLQKLVDKLDSSQTTDESSFDKSTSERGDQSPTESEVEFENLVKQIRDDEQLSVFTPKSATSFDSNALSNRSPTPSSGETPTGGSETPTGRSETPGQDSSTEGTNLERLHSAARARYYDYRPKPLVIVTKQVEEGDPIPPLPSWIDLSFNHKDYHIKQNRLKNIDKADGFDISRFEEKEEKEEKEDD